MPTKLWKKGEPSPNPAGRPKGSFSLTELLRQEIQKAPEGQKQTYAEAFLKKMLHKAIIEGDHASQRLIMNYLEGLPRQNVDITSLGEKIIPIYGGQSTKGISLSGHDSSEADIPTQTEN